MRKIIVFLMCVFAVATSAMATEPTCNGGTPITANDGTTFCESNKVMNWWSAFTWCESQGRTLAEFSKMCGDVPQSPAGTAGQCPNLQNAVNNCVWSSLASGDNYAIIVCSDGAVHNGNRAIGNGRNTYLALCE